MMTIAALLYNIRALNLSSYFTLPEEDDPEEDCLTSRTSSVRSYSSGVDVEEKPKERPGEQSDFENPLQEDQ